MNKVICPLCAKEIKPVEYGNGWLWICCGKVAHNTSRLEESKRKREEGDSQTDDVKA